MPLPSKQVATVAEYFRMEHVAAAKHEFRDGRIIAMAGNSYNHCVIAANTIMALGLQLKGKPCRVLDSNLRVGIPGTALYTYPDASVFCGPPHMDAADPTGMTATNPRVIVEILSESTEAYDRGEKFNRYRRLDSLQDYVLIRQDAPGIETFHRQAEGTWLFSSVSGLAAAVHIAGLQIDLALADVYAGVEFTARSSDAAES